MALVRDVEDVKLFKKQMPLDTQRPGEGAGVSGETTSLLSGKQPTGHWVTKPGMLPCVEINA